ncbi:hypothetical protein BVC93_11480 [Mycobacterium sp. MS1601]|uniref:DUF2710 family protein n=1 Tax=Mycobacterium sp. MS1601 TaxID=1936029 RepID=UPI0009796D48|nr:DUF2710 family protein [Mycobacterium sp. MS1601]AQA02949.1 hypothetical protein BVC93_11480 [Mycobacterium sp. MS1601]
MDDRALVDEVLRELNAAADRWEKLVAEAEKITYSVDLGDIQAVVNSDGKLLELTLHPSVTVEYTHTDLARRLNAAFDALREEARADNEARYGGGLR